MTNQQKEQVVRLHDEGCSYSKIALKLDLSENTIKSFCKRNKTGNPTPVETAEPGNSICQQCEKLIQQREKTKQRKFCSDTCRMAWWNTHQEKVIKKSVYHIVCTGCGQAFDSYGNKNRKYCSRECYFKARFGGSQ